jgi:uncharacterized membrane protein YfcA
MFASKMISYLILAVAGLGAGLINSVAGGGSFITFPALIFTGVPSIIANASSTMALIPSSLASVWAYREDFRELEGFPFRPLFAVSLCGGAIGALLLLYTSQRTFDFVLPWLMFTATGLFTFGRQISRFLKPRVHIGVATVVLIQLLISTYGGYFGGGVGFLMLATWTVFGVVDIHVLSAHRNMLGATMNSVAVALFIAAHKIWWPQTLVMLGGAVIGGYGGAWSAKRVDPRYVRAAITAIGVSITIVFFLRQH